MLNIRNIWNTIKILIYSNGLILLMNFPLFILNQKDKLKLSHWNTSPISNFDLIRAIISGFNHYETNHLKDNMIACLFFSFNIIQNLNDSRYMFHIFSILGTGNISGHIAQVFKHMIITTQLNNCYSSYFIKRCMKSLYKYIFSHIYSIGMSGGICALGGASTILAFNNLIKKNNRTRYLIRKTYCASVCIYGCLIFIDIIVQQTLPTPGFRSLLSGQYYGKVSHENHLD